MSEKIALVTGASGGIGRAIAEELMKEGCRVTITGRNPQTGAETVAEMAKEGLTEVMYLAGDMMSEEFCHEIAEKTYEKWGRIDYLVNNAFAFDSTKRNIDNEVWMRAFNGGPLSYARMMKFCGEYMVKNGGGAIVNVSSISGHIAQSMWIYNTLKGGVGMMTKAAALNYARDNIRINAMSPAGIWTRVTTRGMTEPDVSPEDRAKRAFGSSRETMLLRLGEPVECAAATLFLLSDDASYITGSEFMVDAGFLTLGSQGSIDKGFRDEREYSLEPIYGRHYAGTKFTKPTSHYPELFEKLNKEVDR